MISRGVRRQTGPRASLDPFVVNDMSGIYLWAYGSDHGDHPDSGLSSLRRVSDGDVTEVPLPPYYWPDTGLPEDEAWYWTWYDDAIVLLDNAQAQCLLVSTDGLLWRSDVVPPRGKSDYVRVDAPWDDGDPYRVYFLEAYNDVAVAMVVTEGWGNFPVTRKDLYASRDGVTWTRVLEDVQVNTMTRSHGRFVAFNDRHQSDVNNTTLPFWWSSDGFTWTKVTLNQTFVSGSASVFVYWLAFQWFVRVNKLGSSSLFKRHVFDSSGATQQQQWDVRTDVGYVNQVGGTDVSVYDHPSPNSGGVAGFIDEDDMSFDEMTSVVYRRNSNMSFTLASMGVHPFTKLVPQGGSVYPIAVFGAFDGTWLLDERTDRMIRVGQYGWIRYFGSSFDTYEDVFTTSAYELDWNPGYWAPIYESMDAFMCQYRS